MRSGVEWSGVEWSGVEWSGVEWSGVTHTHAYAGVLAFAGTDTGDGSHVLTAATCPFCRERRFGSPFDPLPDAPPPLPLPQPAPPAAHNEPSEPIELEPFEPLEPPADAPAAAAAPSDRLALQLAHDEEIISIVLNRLGPYLSLSLDDARAARDRWRDGAKAEDVLTVDFLEDEIWRCPP